MQELDKETRKPTIVLPFIESTFDSEAKDLYLYLRPETNGIRVESLLFGVIHNDAEFRDGISLVYLANLPGDFVSKHRVIERHYALKCAMAKRGRESFTSTMIERFENWYKVKWDDVEVVSAYDAINILNIDSKTLFDTWVKNQDFFYTYGQSIKKIGNLYVINYDIPELLKKNSSSTDIAVMVLRTNLSNRLLSSLILKMEIALKAGGAIDPKTPPRRCFHYTKSPLEEILDGDGYLYTDKGDKIKIETISFVSYLLNKGINIKDIISWVYYPIVTIDDNGYNKEVYLYDYLMG
ncbi:MAG: hypothetical protein B6229_08915, partial [Spirochaetaceae bacterium 4572_7]